MSQKFYKKAEQFVVDSFTKVGKVYQIKHFTRTVYWLKKFKPKADEAFLIAAMAHDIERAFRKKDVITRKYTHGFVNQKFYQLHAKRGAEIIAKFLKAEGAELELTERVKTLVLNHEKGGDDDENLLRDADSVSFFENNVTLFLDKLVPEVGKEKVREKLDWMFNRITLAKARQIAKPWYKEAIKSLDSKK